MSFRGKRSEVEESAVILLGFATFPTGTSQITAHYAFHRQRLGLLYDHRATGQLLTKRLQLFRKFVERCRDKVIPKSSNRLNQNAEI